MRATVIALSAVLACAACGNNTDTTLGPSGGASSGAGTSGVGRGGSAAQGGSSSGVEGGASGAPGGMSSGGMSGGGTSSEEGGAAGTAGMKAGAGNGGASGGHGGSAGAGGSAGSGGSGGAAHQGGAAGGGGAAAGQGGSGGQGGLPQCCSGTSTCVPNSALQSAGENPNKFQQRDCTTDQARCIDNALLPGSAGPAACFGAPDGASTTTRTNGDCVSKCMLTATEEFELGLFADDCPTGYECAPCGSVPGGC